MKTLESGLFVQRETLSNYLELTKPGITMMVGVTTLLCAYMGFEGSVNFVLLFHTFLASLLVAAGGNILNMFMEWKTDLLMVRTQKRPLPDKRLHPMEALGFGVIVSTLGVFYFARLVNPLTALISAISVASYILIYTPLKKKTWLCTVIGAIPGAFPAMAGWSAVQNTLEIQGWILFLIMFLWQMPHFLAIGWMYREDYARANLPILPVIDTDGHRTGRQAVLFALLLLPTSLLPTLLGMTGNIYLVLAFGLGGYFLLQSIRFYHFRTNVYAKRLFFASIIYLPVLLACMVMDKV